MMAGMDDQLERSALAECEAVIERGFQTFWEVGRALVRIRDEELFRAAGYRSFAAYCRRRWDQGHACRLIDAADAMDNLLPMGNNLPENERQVRPLTRLEPDQQLEAWKLAVEQTANGKPTYREVEDIVRTQFEGRLSLMQEQAERAARAKVEGEMRAAEKRADDAEELGEQLARERREADEKRRRAEERAETLLKERDDVHMRRVLLFGRLVDAIKTVAEFHSESPSDTWDGICSVKANEDVTDIIEKASRLLAWLKSEHPNAKRKPGIVIQKPG
jgi:hypothetical protein